MVLNVFLGDSWNITTIDADICEFSVCKGTEFVHCYSVSDTFCNIVIDFLNKCHFCIPLAGSVIWRVQCRTVLYSL